MSKHPLADCDNCPYNDPKYKYVPTKGGDGSIAFVGEAPGKYEARQGEPFVGSSGKLLNLLMESQSIDRKDATLTNAVACRPPDNETPKKAAVAACKPRLLDELAGHDTVVALGNTAAQTLLKTRIGITKLRIGFGETTDLLPGTRVIPTIHPAACLRNADAFPNLAHDIEKINSEPPVWIEPKFKVAEDVDQAIKMLEAVDDELTKSGNELVVDIETDFDKDEIVDHADNLTLVGLCYEKNKAVLFGEEVCKSKRFLDKLRWLFRRRRIVAHNGKFDLGTLWHLIGYIPLYGDTMLANYSLDERGGIHGLEQMAVELLGSPKWKHRQDEDPYLYNAYDCCNEFSLWEYLKERMEKEDVRRVHDHLIQASNAFMQMEHDGIGVDTGYNEELENELLDILEEMIDEFPEHDGAGKSTKGHLNPNSPAQVLRWFVEKGFKAQSSDKDYLKVVREDDKAQRSLGRMVGQETLDEINTFIDILLAYRKEKILHGTFVKGIRKRIRSGRIHPTYTLHNTVSGRPSCRNPNLQNIPIGSRIKTQFIPIVPGNVFVHVDYKQAELRTMAWLAQDEALRYIFEETDRDIFDELNMRIYGHVAENDSFQYKEERVKTKTFAYGVGYGMEYGAVAKRFNMPVSQAKAEHAQFLNAIPDVVRWQAATRQKVLDGEDLITPFGRHRRFMLITNENKVDVMNEALAFLPSSTASDICVKAFIQLTNDGLSLRNIIHDAILAECKPDEANDVAEHMQKTMQAAAVPIVGDYVTFKTDATIGKNWGSV